MKSLSLILLMFFTSILVAQESGQYYKSMSGKVSYNFEIGETHVDYTLTFDEHGKKQSFYTKSTNNGMEEKVKTIITETHIYVVNYGEEQVIKIPKEAAEEEASKSSGGFNLSTIVNEVKGKENLKTATETILGRACDVYVFTENEGSKGKYWIWNNFLLKAEFVDGNGQHTYMEATHIEPDYKVPANEFEVPSNFAVTDMSEMMKQMQQMQEMYGVPDEE